MGLNFPMFLLFAACLCVTNAKNSADSSSDDQDLFVPTPEWKVVRKGQKIPRGLHVRINFETGLTEAKLLNNDENAKAVAEVPATNDGSAENSNLAEAGSLKFAEGELKAALKNIKNDDGARIKGEGDTFRTYEELKRDLSDINLAPKTDMEILNELVNEHGRVIKEKDISTEEDEILSILEDLEYLVHQYDNANEFVRLNGFREVIFINLNSSSVQVRQETLKLLGSSVQNNAKVQIHALETDCVGVLLRILALDTDYGVKNRAIFALSSILRRFPMAQLKFVENAGLNVFVEIVGKSSNIKIQLKIVTLLNDLILEHKYVLEDVESVNRSEKLRQYDRINLKEKLSEHGWCKDVHGLLSNVIRIDENDHDGVEKCLTALISVLDICDPATAMNIKGLVVYLRAQYRTLLLAERPLDDDDSDLSYYTHLLDLCWQIINYLDSRYKLEL